MTQDLRIDAFGIGPDVVLLHGWGLHSGIWEHLAEHLAERCRVTTIDLPGHGRNHDQPLAGDLDAVAAQIDAVAPSSAVWVGWSLGGLIAQRIADRHSSSMQALLLIASSPRFVQAADWQPAMPLARLRAFADDLRADPTGTLQRFLALEVHGSASASAQLRELQHALAALPLPSAGTLAAGLRLLEDYDLRSDWENRTVPTTLLLGERDRLVPPALAAAVRQHWPRTQVQVLAAAGHAPFLTHTAEVAALIGGLCGV